MSRALAIVPVSVSPVKVFILGAALALALCCPVPAQAAQLTDAQIQSILGVLSSFGVSQSVMQNTEMALRGHTTTPACSAGTTLQNGQCVAPNNQNTQTNQNQNTQNTQSQAATTPSLEVSYPTKGETYDATTATHVGTRILIQWKAKNIPAGSLICVWLVGNSNVVYPHPDTGNCVTTNYTGSVQGYSTVPPGTYKPRVTAINSQGATIASAEGSSIGIALLDRPWKDIYATLTSGGAYNAGTLTLTGTATVSTFKLRIAKATVPPPTVYPRTTVSVANGQWSHTTTVPLEAGSYRVYLESDGNEIADFPIVVGTQKNGTSVSQAALSATPSSGKAPLDVTFVGSSGNGCDGKSYTLDFGDNTSQYRKSISNTSCNPFVERSHRYSTSGTYTAKLYPPTSCTSAGVCTTPAPIATAVVTVTNTTSGGTTGSTGNTGGDGGSTGGTTGNTNALVVPTTVSGFYSNSFACIFGRNATAAELADFRSRHSSTADYIRSMYRQFYSSDSFTTKNYSNDQYVLNLYNCVLFRNADTAGRTHWVSDLESGRTRAQVLDNFLMSTEFEAQVLPTLRTPTAMGDIQGFFVTLSEPLASVADTLAAAYVAPFSIITDLLTDILYSVGVGRSQAAAVVQVDLPLVGGELSLNQRTALAQAVGYTGSFEPVNGGDEWGNWLAIGERQQAWDVLVTLLAAHAGDTVGEVYTLFPNLDPAYVTLCGATKADRDARARSMGFTGMYSVSDTNGVVLATGEFSKWLAANPSRMAEWDIFCPNTSATTAPTCSLYATPNIVSVGSNTTLSWNSTNATHTSFQGGQNALQGSTVVAPQVTTTYTLVAYGTQNRSATCKATVSVASPGSASMFHLFTVELADNLAAVEMVPVRTLTDLLTELFVSLGVR